MSLYGNSAVGRLSKARAVGLDERPGCEVWCVEAALKALVMAGEMLS